MLFGKQKPAKEASKAAPADSVQEPATIVDGELIVETLFVEEKNPTKTSRFAGLSEEGEIIDVKPVAAPAPKEKGSRNPRGFGRLFGRKGSDVSSATSSTGRGESPLTEHPASESASSAPVPDAAEVTPPGQEARPEQSRRKKSKQKPPKEKKPSQKKVGSRRFARRSAERFLTIALDAERTLFWRLSRQGVEPVETLPDGAVAISFSAEDQRYPVDTRLTQKQAEVTVVQEVGEAVHVINRSKDLRTLYATPRARIERLSYRLGPGQLLLDQLARERARDAEALIVGVELKDHTGRDALLILYYLSATGRSSAPQVSVYPDNRDFLVSQFAAAHQAARENAQVLLLDHIALFEAAQSLALYPNEPMLGSIPVRKLWTHAAALAVLGATGALVFAYQTWNEYERLRSALTRTQNAVQQLQSANALRLESSPRALARTLSLDIAPIFRQAQNLWLPGGRVSVMVDGTSAEYVITLPLQTRSSTDRRLAVPTDGRVIDLLLNREPPTDCTRGDLNLTGNFNEAQLIIRCEAAARPLDRYRSY